MDKSDRLAIRISPELKEQLRLVCADRDIPEAQAIREGIRMWLEAKGIMATPKRARKGGRMKK